MIPLTECIDNAFEKWFNELTSYNHPLNTEILMSDLEYQRVILNKICCVIEDLKYYSIIDKQNYFSI